MNGDFVGLISVGGSGVNSRAFIDRSTPVAGPLQNGGGESDKIHEILKGGRSVLR